MSVVRCLRCRDEVTVPVGIDPEAIVACPLCREQYTFQTLLDHLPPPLVVISSPRPERVYSDSHVFAGACEPPPPIELNLHEAVPAFQVDPTATPVTDSPPLKTRQRRVAKPTSPLWQMAKVMLGGVGGLVIAQLVLWQAGKDPFEMAPTVSPYVPWLFRSSLRSARPSATRDGLDTGGGRLSSLPVSPDDNPRKRPRRKGGSSMTASEQESPGSMMDDAARTNDDQSPVSATPDSPRNESDSTSKTAAVSALIDAPVWDSGELAKMLDTVQVARTKWDNRAPSGRNTALSELYLSLVKLAKAVTYADPMSAATQPGLDKVSQWMAELGEDQETILELADAASQWISKKKEPHEGVFLAAKVKSVRESASLHRLELEMAEKERKTASDGRLPFQLIVYSQDDPLVKPGQTLILLGTLIPDPSHAIRGYDEDDELVIWLGQLTVVESRSDAHANLSHP